MTRISPAVVFGLYAFGVCAFGIISIIMKTDGFNWFFCRHLWQDMGEDVFLREERNSDGWLYGFYAVEQRCYRCQKKRIIPRKKRVTE